MLKSLLLRPQGLAWREPPGVSAGPSVGLEGGSKKGGRGSKILSPLSYVYPVHTPALLLRPQTKLGARVPGRPQLRGVRWARGDRGGRDDDALTPVSLHCLCFNPLASPCGCLGEPDELPSASPSPGEWLG